jgi:hypothetical protein
MVIEKERNKLKEKKKPTINRKPLPVLLLLLSMEVCFVCLFSIKCIIYNII